MRRKLVVKEPTLVSPTDRQISATEWSVLRSSAAARSSRRVSRYACGDSPNSRRNSREKCARERPAAAAMSSTSSGSVYRASARSLALSRCRAGGAKAMSPSIAYPHRQGTTNASAAPGQATKNAPPRDNERGKQTMKIIYTYTDEAPALATPSLLPIIEAFASQAGVDLELRDISLAGRILAQFPDRLSDDQRVPDALAELGELAKTPEANIIKLPNISASIPQLKAAIKELQNAGYDVPDYPDDARTRDAKAAREAYDRVKGSAVNPVLREGNSDRRAPASAKAYARKHPHSMGAWSTENRSHVATMSDGDFRSTERSITMDSDNELRIECVAGDGAATVLKGPIKVLAGEVVDGSVMRAAALDAFLQDQIADAKDKGLLFSLHLKATMMKVSDPIIFGHAVRAFFAGVFTEHHDALEHLGASPNNGLGAILSALDELPT